MQSGLAYSSHDRPAENVRRFIGDPKVRQLSSLMVMGAQALGPEQYVTEPWWVVRPGMAAERTGARVVKARRAVVIAVVCILEFVLQLLVRIFASLIVVILMIVYLFVAVCGVFGMSRLKCWRRSKEIFEENTITIVE